MPCFSIESNLKSRRFLWKIRTAFKEIASHHIFWQTIKSSKSTGKKSWGNSIVHKFLRGIWSHTQRKTGANTTCIESSQRNCYCYNDALQKTKAMVYSPDGDTKFFNIVAVVLHRDSFTPYLFILCQDHIFCTSIDLVKENCFILKKGRSRKH